MKIAPPWRLILPPPSLTRIQTEMRSPSRKYEHQSGFPQIRQGLRRLTRQKTFEVDEGMHRCQPPYFRTEENRQSGSLGTWSGGVPQTPPSTIPSCSQPLANWTRLSQI